MESLFWNAEWFFLAPSHVGGVQLANNKTAWVTRVIRVEEVL